VKTPRLGKLPPRYSFMLNRHAEERLSKCPKCHKHTYRRKFPLLIHIEECGLLTLGKSGPYCAPCELFIVHQDELEAELAQGPKEIADAAINGQYFVVGMVDKKYWQSGLRGHASTMQEVLRHTADFKEFLKLEVQPGGWFPVSGR